MDELLSQAVGPLIAIFLVTAMFSLGLDLTLRQIVDSLRDKRLVTKSLLINLLLVPLLAVAITNLIPMHEGLRIGIVVYAIAAGTEGGPKFVQIIGGNTAFAFGLLVLLLTFTVAVVPLLLPLVVPHVDISTGALVGKLLLVVALPICVGLFLNARFQALAARISPFAHHLSMFLLYGLFVLLIYVNFQEIVALQTNALLAGLLLFALAFTAGYLAGGAGAAQPARARDHDVCPQWQYLDIDRRGSLPARPASADDGDDHDGMLSATGRVDSHRNQAIAVAASGGNSSGPMSGQAAFSGLCSS